MKQRRGREGRALPGLAALVLVLALAAACAGVGGQPEPAGPKGSGVFLFLSSPRKPANDVRFSLTGLRFMTKDGVWTEAPLERTLDSVQCAEGQVKVAEFALPPGSYLRMAWRIGAAWMVRDNKTFTLALPGADGSHEMEVDLSVPAGGRTAFFADWDPDRSVIDSYSFDPQLTVRGQGAAMTDVQIYVACFGSDAVVVADRERDEVAAVIGVGRGPVGVVADPARKRVYVANSGSDDISVIDSGAGRVVSTFSNSGCSPTEIALSADGKWLVAVNPDTDNVSVIDTALGSLVRQIGVGRRPVAVVFDPSRGLFYVSNADSNTVSVLDPTRAAPVRTVRVGQRPGGMTVYNSVLYVANTGSDNLSVVEAPAYTVTTTIPAPHSPLWVAPGHADRLCLTTAASNEVSFVYVPMRMVIKTVAAGRDPGRMATDSMRRKLYVANGDSGEVTVVDLASGRVRAVLPVGRQPRGIAVHEQ